jgi:hypothetical protein
MKINEVDPYAILNISYHASDQEIQNAFQIKMSEKGTDTELVLFAYGMIRGQSGRNRWRWDDFRTFLFEPFSLQTKSVDKESLAKELAFLSPWELGDDTCLN